MSSFNGVGVLKLSDTERDLLDNGKCQAAMESLEISCWNNTDAFQPRLNGMENYPNASEKRGLKYHSSLCLMVSFPQAVLSVLIFFQAGDQERKRGLSSELLISCLFSCSFSEISFSLLAEASASPELVIWWPPFPRASWLKVHSCFLHSQTCHRWQVCWWLLGFRSNVVVMTNTYLPICVFRSWSPGYKKQIQQVESCLWFTCLFKFLGNLFCLI